jgi:hypothetical protein
MEAVKFDSPVNTHQIVPPNTASQQRRPIGKAVPNSVGGERLNPGGGAGIPLSSSSQSYPSEMAVGYPVLPNTGTFQHESRHIPMAHCVEASSVYPSSSNQAYLSYTSYPMEPNVQHMSPCNSINNIGPVGMNNASAPSIEKSDLPLTQDELNQDQSGSAVRDALRTDFQTSEDLRYYGMNRSSTEALHIIQEKIHSGEISNASDAYKNVLATYIDSQGRYTGNPDVYVLLANCTNDTTRGGLSRMSLYAMAIDAGIKGEMEKESYLRLAQLKPMATRDIQLRQRGLFRTNVVTFNKQQLLFKALSLNIQGIKRAETYYELVEVLDDQPDITTLTAGGLHRRFTRDELLHKAIKYTPNIHLLKGFVMYKFWEKDKSNLDLIYKVLENVSGIHPLRGLALYRLWESDKSKSDLLARAIECSPSKLLSETERVLWQWASDKPLSVEEQSGRVIAFQKISVEIDDFSNCYGKRTLDLSELHLSTLPDNLFLCLKNLKYLNLEKNQLTTLSESIGNLTELIFLNLENNQLTDLPESIWDLKKTTLYFLENNLNQKTMDKLKPRISKGRRALPIDDDDDDDW